MIRRCFLMVIMLVCCSNLVQGQYTNEEIAQAAQEECTWVSYSVGPATTNMNNKYTEFTYIYQHKLDWAEQLRLTPTQITAIENLRDEGNALKNTFDQKWHGDDFEINPSGLSEVWGDGYIWVYGFPELSNYQYMWKWYERGSYCMTPWLHPIAIESYSQAQIRFEHYIDDCITLTNQLDDIIRSLEAITSTD